MMSHDELSVEDAVVALGKWAHAENVTTAYNEIVLREHDHLVELRDALREVSPAARRLAWRGIIVGFDRAARGHAMTLANAKGTDATRDALLAELRKLAAVYISDGIWWPDGRFDVWPACERVVTLCFDRPEQVSALLRHYTKRLRANVTDEWARAKLSRTFKRWVKETRFKIVRAEFADEIATTFGGDYDSLLDRQRRGDASASHQLAQIEKARRAARSPLL